MSSWRRWC
ncbi:hypothetical protein U0070_018730 [Myodes glareolus]|uniref:Uncharacterized protein n=1 Tax=Myodes glareolus TaxID=447135 RepID=A0AAW0I378_MYOGA